MNVLVDSNIWSIGLRRDHSRLNELQLLLKSEFNQLFDNGDIVLIDPVRQEVLSGVKQKDHYDRLRIRLRSVPSEPLVMEDYEEAARIYNQCASMGIAAYSVDCLICAAALRNDWLIFTLDKDFGQFKKIVGLKLHKPPSVS